MIVAVDTTVLMHLIDPSAEAAPDSDGNVPRRCQERIAYLLECMIKSGDRMIVPTPSLSEILTGAGDAGPEWVAVMQRHRAIRIAPFDERAAIECAELARHRAQRSKQSTRNKAKFDEQIIAIAVAERAEIILSDDRDIKRLAPEGITVKGISDLDLPPEDPQRDMFQPA